MAPRVERPDPPYLQIVKHYRQMIKDGELVEGARLPSGRELAEGWGVANTTVFKAMRRLQAEGLVRLSNQGTVVTFGETSTYTPRDRLRAMRRSGRIYPPSDRTAVVSAEVMPAPAPVADAMGIEAGDLVVRRERITYHGDKPVTLSVSWLPGELAEAASALLSTERLPGGTITVIREATGREVARDTYRECARLATPAEVTALGLPEGEPHAVLTGENTWYEQDGAVLEFGEYVIPSGLWVIVEDA